MKWKESNDQAEERKYEVRTLKFEEDKDVI